jgi:hypothetical protein
MCAPLYVDRAALLCVSSPSEREEIFVTNITINSTRCSLVVGVWEKSRIILSQQHIKFLSLRKELFWGRGSLLVFYMRCCCAAFRWKLCVIFIYNLHFCRSLTRAEGSMDGCWARMQELEFSFHCWGIYWKKKEFILNLIKKNRLKEQYFFNLCRIRTTDFNLIFTNL